MMIIMMILVIILIVVVLILLLMIIIIIVVVMIMHVIVIMFKIVHFSLPCRVLIRPGMPSHSHVTRVPLVQMWRGVLSLSVYVCPYMYHTCPLWCLYVFCVYIRVYMCGWIPGRAVAKRSEMRPFWPIPPKHIPNSANTDRGSISTDALCTWLAGQQFAICLPYTIHAHVHVYAAHV